MENATMTDTTATEAPTVVGEFRTPRGRPALMSMRPGTNDWNTLNACMTEDEYGLRSFNGNGWAVDIGGYLGGVGSYLGGVGIGLALDNPGLRVLIVEPVPDNARLIEQNIDRNGVRDRVTLIVGAVGDGGPVEVWHSYSGSESLEHHRFVGNSSLAYDHGGEAPHETARYERSLTVGDFANLTGDADSIDLLKIDCEGGEWAFLDAPGVAVIDVIVGEAHSVRGHRGDDIIGLLAATHDVTITGDPAGTVEFRAVARG